MSVTIKDVAERAGVSIATVSYVLTGTKKVKDSTREKVNKAIRELNYAPNLLAKGLKDKKAIWSASSPRTCPLLIICPSSKCARNS